MKRLIGLFLAAALVLSGCAGSEQLVQESVFSMDTVMDLKIWGADAQTGMEQVRELIDELAATWSATDADSLLSAMNDGLLVTLNEEQGEFLAQVEQLSRRTGGAFNPKLGNVSLAWGFTTEEKRVPSAQELELAMAQSRWDLGAAVKGYAGQRAADLLAQLNVDRAVLNMGGNVQTFGEKSDGSPWLIGITNPNGGDTIGVVSVSGTASVVTSGSYQRYFEQDGVRYHHIIDPETGYPADSGLVSVTVICRDGLTADALSTALFVMGLEEATRFWQESDDFEAVFILESGDIYATEGANLSGCTFEVISREE